jgi:hypothetical protein
MALQAAVVGVNLIFCRKKMQRSIKFSLARFALLILSPSALLIIASAISMIPRLIPPAIHRPHQNFKKKSTMLNGGFTLAYIRFL